MKKSVVLSIVVIVMLIGISAYLGYKMIDYKNTLIASTTYCKAENECATLVLDSDGCSAIPMSKYTSKYFELTYTDWGGCDALVVKQPVATCKENRCVFTKN